MNASTQIKEDVRLFTLGFILLLFTCGTLLLSYVPFHDDIGSLVKPFSREGFNLFGFIDSANKPLFFRPIEYFTYGFSERLGLVNVLILFNFILVSLTAVFAVRILSIARPSIHRNLRYAAMALFVLHPGISVSTYGIDLFSQCLANFCTIFLLWSLLSRNTNEFLQAFICFVGIFSKESFLPVFVVFTVLKFLRDRKVIFPACMALLMTIFFVGRTLIVDVALVAQVDRYHLRFGPNVLKNLLLHLASFLYYGSSPDLYSLSRSREVLPIIFSLALALLLLACLARMKITSTVQMVVGFAVLSLFPGIFTGGVSEHNATSFVWLGLILLVIALTDALNYKLVAAILLVASLLASVSVVRKTALLAETMRDFKAMSVEFSRTGGTVSCKRKFARPFSYYLMDSATHLPYLKSPAGVVATCHTSPQL